jgi:hypothetical protein
MTRWLTAARLADSAGTKPTEPTKLASVEVLSVSSVLSELQGPAPNIARRPATKQPAGSLARNKTSPHGVSVAGSPLTWTGRVVSLDEWRDLSDWDRHGPNGRIWNALTRNWERD